MRGELQASQVTHVKSCLDMNLDVAELDVALYSTIVIANRCDAVAARVTHGYMDTLRILDI